MREKQRGATDGTNKRSRRAKKAALKLSQRQDRGEKFETDMRKVSSAYLRGIKDEVEIRLHREHISAFGFDNYAVLFPRSDAEIEDCYKKAKSISDA